MSSSCDTTRWMLEKNIDTHVCENFLVLCTLCTYILATVPAHSIIICCKCEWENRGKIFTISLYIELNRGFFNGAQTTFE